MVHNASFYANVIILRHSLSSLIGTIVTSTPTPIGKWVLWIKLICSYYVHFRFMFGT